MSLSRWAAAILLAGFTLAAVVAAPKPPPRTGDAPAGTAPAAKPKLQFEVSITHGGKTAKVTTAPAALTKLQSIQKLIARGSKTVGDKPPAEKPAEGDKPAEGAGDFSCTFTLNGDTKEVSDPAEAEKVCQRINEALVTARKKGEDLSAVKIPTEDAPMAVGPGAGDKPEPKGPRRPPIRGKNADAPPMQNPMNAFAGGIPPMGGIGPGPVGPVGPQNGNGLERLISHLPPAAQQAAMLSLRQWIAQHNGMMPTPNQIQQILGEVMKSMQKGQLPPNLQLPQPGSM